MKKLVFAALLFFAADKVNSGGLFSKLSDHIFTYTKYRLYFIFSGHRDNWFDKINMPTTFTNPIKDTKQNGWDHGRLPLFYIQWDIPNLTQNQIDKALDEASVVQQMLNNNVKEAQWIESIR